MRGVGYSLFNSVWLYRMMTMASCTPGHLSGAILGIYAVLCAQIDSTSQSALGYINIPCLGERATLDLSALATGSFVVAKPRAALVWGGKHSPKATVGRSRRRLDWAPRGVWE